MEGYDPHQQQQQHHHHQQQQQISISATNIDVAGDRFPQWTIQETSDFLVIRAELDQAFMETKRNKVLWEMIATGMREKGYARSAEQCKCKWKNLVTRYKGCETMESDAMRQQFPFYTELQTIFAARMQRMLYMEAEGGMSASGSKRKLTQSVSTDEDDENDQLSDAERKGATKKKKRAPQKGGASSSNAASGLKEILEDFMRQQMEMETERMRAYEAREEARRGREMEWRQAMEELERERVMMEKMWREREEERKAREEVRAEKRDALVTILLNKLRREDSL